jgi:pre-mRNA-processing factor 8
MKIPKIAVLVIHSSEPKMVIFNLYDNWLETVSPPTAFARLMLVLRALLTSKHQAWDVLRPSASVLIPPDHIWPSHTQEEWEEIELKLKDLIVEDYSTKNSVAPNSLTMSEISNIIYGIQIAPPSEERQQLAAEEERQSLTAVTTRTVTRTGESAVIQTLSSYEQTQFQSKSDWRKRALQASAMHLRTARFQVPPENIVDREGVRTIVLPLNLLKIFVDISDPYVQVCGILFGKDEGEAAIEVHAILVPPQSGSYERVDFAVQLPDHTSLRDLRPIGWIHTTALDESLMTPIDGITATVLCQANEDKINPMEFASVVLSYPPGACSIRGFRLNPTGLEWGTAHAETRDRPIGFQDDFFFALPLIITEVYNGWFLIPSTVDWNLNFQSMKLTDIDAYEVDLGKPLRFYDQRHRPNHFLQFVNDLTNVQHTSLDVEDNFA